jgi:proline dehydrogenase
VKKRLRRVLGAAFRLLIRLAASLFVRGGKLPDAMAVCHRLSKQGRTGTIGYFNSTGEPPRGVADASLAALDMLATAGVGSYLSIKAPALTFDRALIGQIVDRAGRAGIGVHFDSHGHDVADPTFDAIEHAVRRLSAAQAAGAAGWTVGCTLPGRWQRSLADADRAAELGLRVRVAKGQWVDPTHPDIDMREGCLALVDRLAGKVHHVAIASHDPPLAYEALRRLQRAGASCELELLVGLPMQGALRVARELRVPVRIYVPFGVSWVPYALTHVQQNPHVALWALRDATLGRLFRLHTP